MGRKFRTKKVENNKTKKNVSRFSNFQPKKSLICIIGSVLFIGDLHHLALDKTDIDAFVDSRLQHNKDWHLNKMTAPVTTEEHLNKIVTALKSATLGSPIIAVVYISGNTTIELLGKMVKKIRECVTPRPAELMTTPCYIGKRWSELADNEVNTYIALLGKIMELTAKERLDFCVLNEHYLDERYVRADSKFHVRTVLDKLQKVIPLPKKMKKNDFEGGVLNFGSNRAQDVTRAQEPEMTEDGFQIKNL